MLGQVAQQPRRGARIGLVGAVKSKRRHPTRAAELYTSPLFRGRVAYVQVRCDRWYLLTARDGLVLPDEVLDPSEDSLTLASSAAKRAWSQRVLEAIGRELGDLRGYEFEIHAGAAYREYGLVAGLEAQGATVDVPARGLSQGDQLAFYTRHSASDPVRGSGYN